jgi:cytochrome c peroxidase
MKAMRVPVAALLLLAAFGARAADPITVVEQKDRAFTTREIHIHPGDTVRFHNGDDFSHQVYTQSPSFSFDSDESAPGDQVDILFAIAGKFQVYCHIHPKMRLDVDVK